MKTLFILCASLAIHAVAFAGLEADIPEANRVILKSGSWIPTAEQTQKALASIETFLGHPGVLREYDLREIKKILGNSRNYRVQFIGVTRKGRKVIECNFFPAAGKEKDWFPYWQKHQVEVDDGGFYFWQMEYDPETGKCSKFSSNGYA